MKKRKELQTDDDVGLTLNHSVARSLPTPDKDECVRETEEQQTDTEGETEGGGRGERQRGETGERQRGEVEGECVCVLRCDCPTLLD